MPTSSNSESRALVCSRSNIAGYSPASSAPSMTQYDPGTADGPTSALGLGLQAGLVLLDELADLVGHSEQLRPLLLVQGDRETAQAVHRHAALLAHLETDAAAALALQLLVLRPQPFDFGLQVFIRHRHLDRKRDCSPFELALLASPIDLSRALRTMARSFESNGHTRTV